MLTVGRPCVFAEDAKLLVRPEVVNDALFHLSRFPVEFHSDSTLSWDELKPRHLIVSEEWEADIMAALAEFPGSGKDGGRCKDNMRVKRRVVVDVYIGPWQPQLLQKHALHDALVQPSESAAIVMRGVRQYTQSF
jgi:hypothetical protein